MFLKCNILIRYFFTVIFSTFNNQQMLCIGKNCRWLDLNLCPLVLEAITLATGPLPLPNFCTFCWSIKILNFFSLDFSILHFSVRHSKTAYAEINNSDWLKKSPDLVHPSRADHFIIQDCKILDHLSREIKIKVLGYGPLHSLANTQLVRIK